MAEIQPARERTSLRKLRNRAFLQMGAFALVATVFFIVIRIWSIMGDCSPHEIDGQCGMSTFFGTLFGATGAFEILSGGAVGVTITYNRKKKRIQPSENHNNSL